MIKVHCVISQLQVNFIVTQNNSKLISGNKIFVDTNAATTAVSPATTKSGIPVNHLYYYHSWIPHNIEVSIDSKGALSVTKLDKLEDDVTSKEVKKPVVENGSSESSSAANPEVDESEQEQIESQTEKPTQKLQYSLSAVVCYIDDKNDDRRNLVSLIKVGPNYHEKLSGSAVSQWYIFNDFRYVFIVKNRIFNHRF